MSTTETKGWELVNANGERIIFSDARLNMLIGDEHGAGCQVRYYDGVCEDAAVLDEVSYEQWKHENAALIAEHRADLAAIDDLFAGK